jgi:hypothetical protein
LCATVNQSTNSTHTALLLMRTVLNSFIVLTVLGAVAPAGAVTLLPNLFAQRYCELRSIGATKDQAIDAAVKDALISEDRWFMVTKANSTKGRSDSIEAARAAAIRCPEYFR